MSYFNGNSHIMSRIFTFAGTQTAKQLDFATLLSTMAPPAVMARGVLGMFKYDVTNELKNIQVPTLIIAADKDKLTKPQESQFMKAHIQGAQFVQISPGNHQSLMERHADVNKAAATFIKSIS